ncbi:hypothetical protein BKA61DRAFT_568518 [Leptodontidium sp. MPI-SDFR-AT-0119]|nr:hypothetical protein BKA61DRAFT_568518 [Leptodontidium sp. MPI-SDFR-AT-0119]
MSSKSPLKALSPGQMPIPVPEKSEARRNDHESYKKTSSDTSDQSSVKSASSTATSRSSSPEPKPLSLLGELPEPVADFFSTVTLGSFPPSTERKVQPWRELWKGPVEPSPDGKLLVACPEKSVYGSNNLGGY